MRECVPHRPRTSVRQRKSQGAASIRFLFVTPANPTMTVEMMGIRGKCAAAIKNEL